MRCRRAGKYDAKSDQTGRPRRKLERYFRVPEVPAFEDMTHIKYGIRRGQNIGMAQRKKKSDTDNAMHVLWKSTTNVCSLRRNGTLRGANRMGVESQRLPASRPLTRPLSSVLERTESLRLCFTSSL